MSNQTPTTKQILTRNITAINTRDIDGYLANQAPDIEVTFSGGGHLQGREELRQYIEAMWVAIPDGKLAFGQQVLAENAMATEVILTGTHTGPLTTPNGTLPPTGRTITLHSVSMLTVKDGLIASEHSYFDQVEMLTQLGIMPDAAGGDSAKPNTQR